ncbi:hypothetical protein RBSWK_05026 [Rhodopirellula baltica SWK14]|uniref:Uncharacterized protein n=1 Tax=Rhodopirellula baltica SWK14 TaxID=993516 RepID=L7CBL6_RHOBT|nr:hypothetical protein RBSWK_05026 [Rhodopirellula baltica SWK14]
MTIASERSNENQNQQRITQESVQRSRCHDADAIWILGSQTENVDANVDS